MSQISIEQINRVASIVQLKAKKHREELIKDKFKQDNPRTRLDGLCYVVSESLYHMTGGQDCWIPKQMEHEGVSHWFLVHRETGTVYDLTEDQFQSNIPHEKARGRGFCTGEPSNRSSILIDAVKKELDVDELSSES